MRAIIQQRFFILPNRLKDWLPASKHGIHDRFFFIQVRLLFQKANRIVAGFDDLAGLRTDRTTDNV